MTNTQFTLWKMWESFDDKIKCIEKVVNGIGNQCYGDSKTTGYNIEVVMDMKKELLSVLNHYKEFSIYKKEEI